MKEAAPRPCVAVVLAAGRGTRMREAADVELTPEQEAAADEGLKFMVPVHGRPFIAWVLDQVEAAGFEDLCLVVSPDSPLLDEPTVTERGVEFVVQREPRGGADAVLASESVVGARDFVVINADNLFSEALLRRIHELDGPGLLGFDREALVRASNIPAERVASFALIREEEGVLTEIVEKPSPEVAAEMAGARVSMTCWRFDSSIYDACRDVTPSSRGELELPDAVALAVRRGTRFRVIPVSEGVLDMSRRGDIPVVERHLAGEAVG